MIACQKGPHHRWLNLSESRYVTVLRCIYCKHLHIVRFVK